MKRIHLIPLLFLLVLAAPAMAQTEEINASVDGVRQGFWRIEGKNGQIREGVYTNGKETGVWKTYDKDGNIKNSITFTEGKAIGEAIFYFPDGRIMEQGIWSIDHWQGDYTRFHENGNKACKFTYDERGRREGEQLYYHENGKLQYKGNWQAGKITGNLAIYDEQGRKTMERSYSADGKFQSAQETGQMQKEEHTLGNFTGTGNYTLYNLDGTLDRRGTFDKGKLIKGKRFVYDENGKLLRTETVENGKVVQSK